MLKATIKKQLTLAGLSRLARQTAESIEPNQKNATVVALSGELGAGKTTFTKAFLKALGVRESVTSPTFILFRPYPLPSTHLRTYASTHFTIAYHLDCYRLEDPKELLKLGLKEMLANPRHLVIIEWAERIKKYLPKNAIWLTLKHGGKKGFRTVRMR